MRNTESNKTKSVVHTIILAVLLTGIAARSSSPRPTKISDRPTATA